MAVFKIIGFRPIEKKDFDHKPQIDVQIGMRRGTLF